MPRPVWHEAGLDPSAVADLLEQAARDAEAGGPGRLDAMPRPAPAGTDPIVLHQAALLVARRRLAVRHAARDHLVVQSVRALDDLARAANLLGERLTEWYALHAPEATRTIGDASRLAALVSKDAHRDAVAQATGGHGPSTGADLDDADAATVQGFAAATHGLHEARAAIEARLQVLMGEVARNVAAVVGPVLGARLVAQAGGLERLATLPAGTVQLLGAETALFRHLQDGSPPPKHGILYQHPKVFQAPPWQRGALARALSLHITRAARADALTGADLRTTLVPSLEAALARIAREKARPRRAGTGKGARRGRGRTAAQGGVRAAGRSAGAPPRAGAGGRAGGRGGAAPRHTTRKPPRRGGKKQRDRAHDGRRGGTGGAGGALRPPGRGGGP